MIIVWTYGAIDQTTTRGGFSFVQNWSGLPPAQAAVVRDICIRGRVNTVITIQGSVVCTPQ
jgi:hypothetical protein